MNELFESIQKLKGVGEKTAKYYEKLGVTSPYDLLYLIPRRYIDFTNPVPIAEAAIDEEIALRITLIDKERPIYTRNGLTIYKMSGQDKTGIITIILYNVDYLYRSMRVGSEYYLYGKVKLGNYGLEINSPNVCFPNQTEKILPIYPLTTGLKINLVRNNIKESLKLMDMTNIEWMPENIIKKYNLKPLNNAVRDIHFPKNIHDAAVSRERLAFDELLQLQLGMSMMKRQERTETSYSTPKDTDEWEFLKTLPFKPTNEQLEAIADIKADMSDIHPMNRLLQGDVGSGKTVVAATAIYFAYKGGMQSALMAPTEILATQHYETLSNFFKNFDINIVLLTGSLKGKARKEILGKIADGTADLIIGTVALMQRHVEYKNLGLVVCDEQHRFGVKQRDSLANKGKSAHKLVMSATPIPRTLALMMYGELDLSVISKPPQGRLPIKTYAVAGNNFRMRIYKFIEKEIVAGHQCYVVCSLIGDETKPDDDKKSVTQYTEFIKQYFPGRRIAMLHGKMNEADKEQTMSDFKAGNIDILVSTTVVEVGVDVPNATIMLIENAEQFGLSQLHQLRGRVGRGQAQSYCILIAGKLNEEIRERLKVFAGTTDGFKIAEEDLKLRGAGDFFGARQHGLPPLKIADLTHDIRLFERAKETADEILSNDPKLENPTNRGLKIEVLKMYARVGDRLD